MQRSFRYTQPPPLTKLDRFQLSIVESRHSFRFHGRGQVSFHAAHWEFAPRPPAEPEPAPAPQPVQK